MTPGKARCVISRACAMNGEACRASRQPGSRVSGVSTGPFPHALPSASLAFPSRSSSVSMVISFLTNRYRLESVCLCPPKASALICWEAVKTSRDGALRGEGDILVFKGVSLTGLVRPLVSFSPLDPGSVLSNFAPFHNLRSDAPYHPGSWTKISEARAMETFPLWKLIASGVGYGNGKLMRLTSDEHFF